MSELPDQIDALLALNAGGAVSHPVPGLAVELLAKAAAELRAIPRGVKELEWKSLPTPMYAEALVLGGPSRYLVDNKVTGWTLWFPGEEPHTHKGRWFEAGDDLSGHRKMRAAAQADYERRIMSAIEIEQGQEPVILDGLPKRKLGHLTDQGYRINGYAVERDGNQGFITDHGFVGWWRPDTEGTATHRHKKRGTEYVLIGIGKMQTGWRDGYGELVDMAEVAIYRSATDPAEIWVRPREEFEDGRFEALAALSQVGEK